MLKSYWRLISYIERFFDNAIVIAVFFLTHLWRDELLALFERVWRPFEQPLLELGPIEDYLLVLGLALPLFNAFLSMVGAYKSMRLISVGVVLRAMVLVSGLTFLCIGFFLYLFKLDLSRSFVATFCLLSGVGLCLERLIVLRALRFFRVRGRNFRNVLIVGTGEQARKLYFEVMRQGELGMRVAGFVAINRERNALDLAAVNGESCFREPEPGISAVYDLPARVVADEESFEKALKKHAIDEVLFTDVLQFFPVVEGLAQIAVEEGVRVTLAADLFSLGIFKSDVSYLGGVPLIHYNSSPIGEDSLRLVVKRLIDVVVSAVLLAVAALPMILVALAIKLDSRGPVFFRQRRIGLNGRHFVLLKFRSMVDGAEKMVSELREHNEMKGPVFKLRDDPRITRVGRWIRRFSVDELPQLLNVLRGDMSLVGPRPPLPEEVSLYLRKQRRRLSMRPGLTCTWQVSGRNEIPDFEEWARLDLEYIDNWSLLKDFKLLLRTIPAVLLGSGAR